jgi:hypothetical protein
MGAMRRACLPVLACLAILAVLAAPAAAQTGTLDRSRSAGAISLGYIEEAPPFSFADAKGEPQGYSVALCREIARGIAEQLGVPKLETRWVPLTIQNRLESEPRPALRRRRRHAGDVRAAAADHVRGRGEARRRPDPARAARRRVAVRRRRPGTVGRRRGARAAGELSRRR